MQKTETSMQQRRLGAWESGFRSAHDMLGGTMLVVSCAKIQAAFSLEKIKKAFLLLFQTHPLLRATIETRGYNSFFVLNANFDNIPVSVIETGISWEEQFQLELHKPVVNQQYLWRVSLLPFENGFYLQLVHHHAIADAISASSLLEKFMEFYSALLQGYRVIATPLPFLQNIEAHLKKQPSWAEYSEQFHKLDQIPVDAIEHDTPANMAGRSSKNHFVRIPAEELNGLLQNCRTNGVTLNSFLNAAMLQTQFQLNPDYKNAALKTPVNLRPYCHPEMGSQHVGCHLSIVETRHQNHQQDPWQLANEYQTALHDSIPGLGFLPKDTDYAEVDIGLVTRLFGVESAKRRTCLPNVFGVSNLGRLSIRTHFPRVTLQDFVFSTNHLVGNYYMFLSALTLADELRLIFSRVSPLISENDAQQFILKFLSILKNETINTNRLD